MVHNKLASKRRTPPLASAAVQEAPRGLHALAVRLEQGLVPHNELGCRLVHEDGRAAGPLVVLE
eukprot:8954139-Alexandrium_andersonii.AAC.1